MRRGPAGRGLFATAPLPAGTVVLSSSPLLAVADVAGAALACTWCHRALPPPPAGGAQACRGGCGAAYCCAACAAASERAGAHAMLCGSMSELDAWSAARGGNFARAAAAALAASFSGTAGRDFAGYWAAVSELVSHPVAADDAELPAVWREGYALVRAALSRRMDAGASVFFDTAFPLRAYARLMGTLRLNSFSLEAPLGVRRTAAAPPATAPPASAPPSLPPSGACATGERAACGEAGGADAAAAAAGGDGAAAGCCSGGGDEAGAAAAQERTGGTALYHQPSFVNHSCEPNLDVSIGPFARLQLSTREAVEPGDELRITYLDSGLPVNVRRGKLLHGYGFECACPLCTRQLAEDRSARAKAAREARQREKQL